LTFGLCQAILYNRAVLAKKVGFVSPSKTVFWLRNCRIFAEKGDLTAAAFLQSLKQELGME
jgi:hypothetical protein